MKTKQICELIGKTILLLNDNRSKPLTMQLLATDGYSDEQIKKVFEWIYTKMDLPN